MSRVSQLSEEVLVTTIQQLEADAIEIKNRQFIGLDSVVYHQNDSGATYDWSGTLPSTGGGNGFKTIIVESTSLFQEHLFGDLIYEIYINSISPANKLSFKSDGIFVYEVTSLLDPARSKKWAVDIEGNDSSTYYAKFYTITSGSADITITI